MAKYGISVNYSYDRKTAVSENNVNNDIEHM
jgi:hypothetical protein